MSIVQELLYVVSNYPGGYRVLYDILYDSQPPASKKDHLRFENTLRMTLSRLKKKGLVENTQGKWSISKEGKEFLALRGRGIKHFFPTRKLSHKVQKQLIVAFDIPEKKRKYRDWLRFELVALGFELVQKSVWFGPALPKEFIEYLNQVKLLEYIRFFKVSEGDLI